MLSKKVAQRILELIYSLNKKCYPENEQILVNITNKEWEYFIKSKYHSIYLDKFTKDFQEVKTILEEYHKLYKKSYSNRSQNIDRIVNLDMNTYCNQVLLNCVEDIIKELFNKGVEKEDQGMLKIALYFTFIHSSEKKKPLEINSQLKKFISEINSLSHEKKIENINNYLKKIGYFSLKRL